jgi:hypothetical protein
LKSGITALYRNNVDVKVIRSTWQSVALNYTPESTDRELQELFASAVIAI